MNRLLILLVLLSGKSFAGVNLQNGNFYVSYTDAPSITRTYNSKATSKGWFGFGWGSPYETHLKVSADGSVVIHENGSGAQTRFVPESGADVNTSVQKILAAVSKKNDSMSPSALKQLEEKLKTRAELRHDYAKRYGIEAKIESGAVLVSKTRGHQTLKKTAKGYLRTYADGKSDSFDLEGKLVSAQDNTTVNFSKKDMAIIKFTNGRQVHITFNASGFVEKLWVSKDKVATYNYSGDDLVAAKDTDGNTFKYEYDKHHNLTKISYSDGKFQAISYEPKTFFTSSVTDKYGKTTSYKYENNPKNPDLHYWTWVEKTNASGKKSRNKFEYENKRKPDGEFYSYRVATEVGGIKSETIYNECCGQPLKITRGELVTEFKYDEKSRLVEKKSTTGEKVALTYDDSVNKIKKVVDNFGWTEFVYNKQKELVMAKNHKNEEVKLSYDKSGQVAELISKTPKGSNTLKFVYNSFKKPTQITLDNVGTLTVNYDNSGKVSKVDSKAGPKMAEKISETMEQLMGMVRPAGVDLAI